MDAGSNWSEAPALQLLFALAARKLVGYESFHGQHLRNTVVIWQSGPAVDAGMGKDQHQRDSHCRKLVILRD
jgi:hypothetical protein